MVTSAPLRLLFIGGTGTISAAAAERAVALGHRLTVLNRGVSSERPAPPGTKLLQADIRNPAEVAEVLNGREFDVVADFISFTPEHVAAAVELFRGRTGQYVFTSSASAYQKPPAHLPILESTPLRNPFWKYSQDKIACEDFLVRAYRDEGFPVTIVRPSHTYDRTRIALLGGWTDIHRMREGLPVIVHGDGTSLWTLTHADDFAVAFVGLLGRPQAVGESYTITSDEALPWTRYTGSSPQRQGCRNPNWCTSPRTPLQRTPRSLALGFSGTGPTPWSSTTPRSKRWCPGIGQKFRSRRAHGRSSGGMMNIQASSTWTRTS
ncbi:chloroplast stem-loop binding protein of 41 kDa b, chloroplastic [Arthrobacter sp. Hiyo8]|nr:chloroplast stem-loop binding protein of 41 kDa b, chloroplastic [Arthrobacter sp. Hiyo8]